MTVTLTVDGMKCGGCVASVEDALRAIAGVREVSVSLEAGEAVVTGDEADPAELVGAIKEAGFEARVAG